VLFDLDNTLLDRDRVFATWANWFARERLGCVEPLTIDECVAHLTAIDAGGYTPRARVFEEVKRRYPPLLDHVDELVAAFREQLLAQIDGLDEAPGALLDALDRQALPWGIVTNGSEQVQFGKIRRLDLESRSRCIIASETVQMRKPDPRIYLLAASRIGVAPERILFVGDHPEFDIVGAAAVGMRTAWLRRTRVWPSEYAGTPPTYIVDSLAELIQLLEIVV
jgi:putative hydrolase of the HAD superfamily